MRALRSCVNCNMVGAAIRLAPSHTQAREISLQSEVNDASDSAVTIASLSHTNDCASNNVCTRTTCLLTICVVWTVSSGCVAREQQNTVLQGRSLVGRPTGQLSEGGKIFFTVDRTLATCHKSHATKCIRLYSSCKRRHCPVRC